MSWTEAVIPLSSSHIPTLSERSLTLPDVGSLVEDATPRVVELRFARLTGQQPGSFHEKRTVVSDLVPSMPHRSDGVIRVWPGRARSRS